jgi:hypothetical protein
LFPTSDNQKHDQQRSYDEEVNERSNNTSYPDIAFMPLHKFTIIPVLGYAAGTHFLSP